MELKVLNIIFISERKKWERIEVDFFAAILILIASGCGGGSDGDGKSWHWAYTIFKSKMKSRRQGGSDANVRGLYVEELTTMPAQIAL